MKTAVFIIILVVLFTSQSSACPNECDCLQHTVVWCDSRGLTQVPSGIEQYTRQLYLFDNNITTIPKAALSKLPVRYILFLTFFRVFKRLASKMDLFKMRGRYFEINLIYTVSSPSTGEVFVSFF